MAVFPTLLAAALAGALSGDPAPSIDSLLDGAASTDEETQPSPAPPQPSETLEQYDGRLQITARAAQAAQGPLDGDWRLEGGDGRLLYRFQITDPGLGYGVAEGAWRDPAVASFTAGSGWLDSVSYDSGGAMLRFNEAGAQDLVVVTIKPAAGGSWAGELWRAGAVIKVAMKRPG